jgi:hypothetical protein
MRYTLSIFPFFFFHGGSVLNFFFLKKNQAYLWSIIDNVFSKGLVECSYFFFSVIFTNNHDSNENTT